MNICGIDPGKTDGIVLLDKNGRLIDKSVMPFVGKEVDHTDLKDVFEHYKSIDGSLHAFIERVNAFGKASLQLMEVPVTYVPPRQWARE